MEEEVLQFGFVSSPVKVGNTVRRQTGPWTPTVHAVLGYLHNHDFSFAPRVQGFDEQGREILAFIHGDAAVRPWPSVLKEIDGIKQAGNLLRKYHDAIEGFVPSHDAEWRIGKCELKPGQIVRHGDLGPWNTIWQNNQLIALIDWDFMQPGERIEDLAQMAYYFVPLRGEAGWSDAGVAERPDFAERLKSLVKSYGKYTPAEIMQALFILLANDREITKRFGNDGVEPWVSFMKRGDIKSSTQDSEWIAANREYLLG